MPKYIYQYPNWTSFTWQDQVINAVFGEVRNLQGKILGIMNTVGFSIRDEAVLNALSMDVVKSSEIEGEKIDYEQVRSSIARKLGLNVAGMVSSSHYIDGIVEMMLDATKKYNQPLSEERLFGWHAALFPTGRSGLYAIEVGRYRTQEMEIVSGPMGKERVHYEAIEPNLVKPEMDKFIAWFNQEQTLDPVLKAAIAHFWFIIIHPFDDGNGRIARALTDLLLARADQSSDRFYSMSNQIMIERKLYYQVLQKAQHSHGDITEWLQWFLNCLKNALLATNSTIDLILKKSEFWQKHALTEFNSRQHLMLNKLLDGFEGKLKSSKWAKIAKCSPDTALRDIKDLIEKGVLRQEASGGRSTNYELVDF